MICMLSIFVFLGHGPIILAAASLTVGNNDLLMLISHYCHSLTVLIFCGLFIVSVQANS